MKCQNATCRKENEAEVEVEGIFIGDGGQRVPITMKICAECAGPLMRSAQPLGVSMSAQVKHAER